MPELELYLQNPTGRFSDRAEDYAKYRPSYPSQAIALALEGLGAEAAAADVGAGTGISARLLANQGVKVWAIEPNLSMREAAEVHPLVDYVDGTAEQTRLPNDSVNLVMCCQSFHWFDKPAALQEFHRILKPGGRVALMWNDRNLDDALTRQYSEIIEKAADRQVFNQADRKSPDALAASSLFTHYRAHTLLQSHPLTPEGLIGLAFSSSYIPKQGAACDQLMRELQELCDRWVSQTIALSYKTNLYLADVF